MRSRNSRRIDGDEITWLADVKSCPCAFCGNPPPCEAHHPTGCQGLHYMAIAACKRCHDGHAWRIGAVTEHEATNETIRSVLLLRSGVQHIPQPTEPLRRSRERKRGSDKILPRR